MGGIFPYLSKGLFPLVGFSSDEDLEVSGSTFGLFLSRSTRLASQTLELLEGLLEEDFIIIIYLRIIF
jgi:hypothetical protein